MISAATAERVKAQYRKETVLDVLTEIRKGAEGGGLYNESVNAQKDVDKLHVRLIAALDRAEKQAFPATKNHGHGF